MPKEYVLPASIVLAALLISGAVLYANRLNHPGVPNTPVGDSNTQAGNPPSPAAVMLVGGRDVVLGDPKAKVTFIEYGDYQCPFCGRMFSEVEPTLRSQYIQTGKVRMVFRNFAFLGPESTAAAEAAECAKDQGKFWAYHDELYRTEIADGHENNGNLTRALFIGLARDAKMDAAAFTSCIDGHKYAAQIQQDNAASGAAGVNSTPTSFINGVKIQGAQPWDAFKTAIDNALKQA